MSLDSMHKLPIQIGIIFLLSTIEICYSQSKEMNKFWEHSKTKTQFNELTKPNENEF